MNANEIPGTAIIIIILSGVMNSPEINSSVKRGAAVTSSCFCKKEVRDKGFAHLDNFY